MSIRNVYQTNTGFSGRNPVEFFPAETSSVDGGINEHESASAEDTRGGSDELRGLIEPHENALPTAELLSAELGTAATACNDGAAASTPQSKLYNARNWANHIDCRPNFNNYFPSLFIQQHMLKRYDPVVDRLSRHEVIQSFTSSHKIAPIPAHALPYDTAESCVCAHKVRSFVNKIKHAVKCLSWTPNAERIIVCNQAGEITLWEGKGFQFDSIVQGHDQCIETMRWAHNESLLLTGDIGGFVKLWQPNINCVHAAAMHGARVTSIAWSPTDRLFATSSDDSAQQLSVWDLFTMRKCRQLPMGKRRGIRCLDWNSKNSVLLAASREIENGLCLFDARSGEAENYITGLNAAILTLEWHPQRENYWVTGGKDRCVRLWDLRMLTSTRGVVAAIRCESDITKLRWHPAHSEIFLSGEGDGSISYWHTRNLLGRSSNTSDVFSAKIVPAASTNQLRITVPGEPPPSYPLGPVFKLSAVHDAYVRDIAIHPLGHLVVTAGCNGICSVWSRLALRSSSEWNAIVVQRNQNQALSDSQEPACSRQIFRGQQSNSTNDSKSGLAESCRQAKVDEDRAPSDTTQTTTAAAIMPSVSKRSISTVYTTGDEPAAKRQCNQLSRSPYSATALQTPLETVIRQQQPIWRLQQLNQQQLPPLTPAINFQSHLNFFQRIPYCNAAPFPVYQRGCWPSGSVCYWPPRPVTNTLPHSNPFEVDGQQSTGDQT